MIVSPPRLVGSRTVAELFNVTQDRLCRKLAAREPLVIAGYLGKVGRNHIWNMHELVANLFTSDAAVELVVDRLTDPTPSDPLASMLCSVGGCDHLEERAGLCPKHLRRLMTAWRHADRSSLVTVQLVAMCQWVVERNAHLTLPPGFDPWAPVCMTPDCDNATNVHGPDSWHGPLCVACSARFWNNAPTRKRPRHWKAKANG